MQKRPSARPWKRILYWRSPFPVTSKTSPYWTKLLSHEEPCSIVCVRQCVPREDKLHRRREQGKENNVFSQKLVGTLRSDNGDVHVAEKQTSHHFKLFCDYPNSPCYSKKGNFCWIWREGNALKFGQRWQNLSPCRSRYQVNLKFGHFTSYLCSESKEMCKKAWCTYRVVVLLINPIVFWRSRCRHRGGFVRSLVYGQRAGGILYFNWERF